MNIPAVPAWKAVGSARLNEADRNIASRSQRRSRITRRQFTRTAAGAAVFGGALSAGFVRPEIAQGKESFAPVPIPGGTPTLNGVYHVFGPAAFDPIDAEPITITNFNGFVGLSYTSGVVTQTNTETGEIVRVPFTNSDLRFMTGEFRGADGRVHHGTFAFV